LYIIGIDIGTSSICGVAYYPENKHLQTVKRDNTSNIETALACHKMQNPESIIQTVTDVIGELTKGRSGLQGIGIAGQMHGILYVDTDGEAVSPLYTWQDGSGNQPFDDSHTYAEQLSAQTGYNLSSGYGIVTHFYHLCNKTVPANAIKLCTIMDYAVMKLTGRKSPLTDYSTGASLGCFDLQNLRFDTEVIEKACIDISFLPETGAIDLPAGYYNGNVPVFPAIGDNQAAFLGSVQDNKLLSVHLSVGTSSQISVYSSEYVSAPSLDTRPLPGGGYILVGAALCGGKSFDILKTFFNDSFEFLGGVRLTDQEVFNAMASVQLDECADNLPEVETLFDGTRAEPNRRGVISSISISNLTPRNLVAGFAKGVCRELYNFYMFIPAVLRNKMHIMTGSGNGLKNSRLLCKAFEEQFQIPLYLPPIQEETAFGACVCIEKLSKK
jgi:sedoheptulokinase